MCGAPLADLNIDYNQIGDEGKNTIAAVLPR
jgi:hypothetical protein